MTSMCLSMTYNLLKHIIGIIKVNFIAEQLYWIPLDCTGVPNKVAIECMSMIV